MLDVVAHLRQHDHEKISPIVAMVQRREATLRSGFNAESILEEIGLRSCELVQPIERIKNLCRLEQ